MQLIINTSSTFYLQVRAGGQQDVLRRQEQNDAHGLSAHLGDRDGEDQDPGDEADQRMDDSQGRKTQQQPDVGGETMLDNKESTLCKQTGSSE